MCFCVSGSYVELEVDEPVVVQRVDHHQVQVLLGVALLLQHIVVSLDAVHDERHQDLQARILLHDGKDWSLGTTFHEFLEVALRARRVPNVLEVFLQDSEERIQKLVGLL